ncbi:hypothetical protein OBBRIDRAFT_811482 [Obba rivulosa]|uniref:RNase III domain-containing protein n=1 Tax=Obba rivulosa TaxID=1052685 RepID=A0A8E2AX77_9APHY|nr:hypothetical protein OBBRIDRAFT_811482 [Obba rivulosa]
MMLHNAQIDCRPLTGLQDYLNQVRHRPSTRNVPQLEAALMERAKNSRHRTPNNNDLLEFIGDRAVNLIGALLVEKVKLSKANHKAVRQVICTNDTFGRLAFYLNFHKGAEMDERDAQDVDDWNPLSGVHPPKVLADLFEAYAGAVYIQHGWTKLERWLRELLDPIVMVATGDHWLSSSPQQIFGDPICQKVSHNPSLETTNQGKLLDYIEFKKGFLAKHGQPLLEALPQNVKFSFDTSVWRLRFTSSICASARSSSTCGLDMSKLQPRALISSR